MANEELTPIGRSAPPRAAMLSKRCAASATRLRRPWPTSSTTASRPKHRRSMSHSTWNGEKSDILSSTTALACPTPNSNERCGWARSSPRDAARAR